MNDTDEQSRMLLDILKEAIFIEVFGIEYYSKLSEMVSDEAAKAVFRGLLLDEKEHKEILENEYRKISGKTIDIGVTGEEYREKAQRIFPESVETLNITETKDILKLGIRTEEKSIEFYSTNAQKTGNKSSKDLLLSLIRFEKEHKAKLEGILYYIDQEGSWKGYSFYTRWFRSGLTGM